MWILNFWPCILIPILFLLSYIKDKVTGKEFSNKRFDCVEDERIYLIEAFRSFRDGEIHNEELENRIFDVELNDESGLPNLINSIMFSLDNPYGKFYSRSEDYQFWTRTMDFIRSGEKYPRYGGCWYRGCLINMFVRVFTLGICSYRKYQIFLRVTQVRSEKFWPFKSEHHYLEVMKKLHEK